MTEKMERRLRMGVLVLVVVIIGMIIMSVNESSKYTQKDHLIEQGQAPVYLTMPDGTTQPVVNPPVDSTPGNNNAATTPGGDTANNAQGGYLMVNKENYESLSYDELVKLCEKKDQDQIKMRLTVYSSLSVSSSIIYDCADAEGNYYSIVDGSQSGVKFKAADVIDVYGKPKGLSKFNNASIPQIQVHLIEKVEE